MAPEVGSSSSRAITDRKKKNPTKLGLIDQRASAASLSPVADTSWTSRPLLPQILPLELPEGSDAAADVRFQSCAAASVFA